MKNFFKFCFLLASAFFCNLAFAIFGIGRVVIDPSNLVQNTSSAIAAVKNEINTSTALIHQIQSTINLAKSLASVNGLANLAGVQKELQLYYQLKNVSTQMSNLLGRSLQLSQSVQGQFGASSQTWADFISAKDQISRDRAKALSDQYSSINQSLDDVAVRRKAIVNQLQNSDGQTAALQAVGAAIDQLIGQNQTIISLLKTQGEYQLANQKDEKSVASGSDLRNQTYEKKLLDAASKLGK